VSKSPRKRRARATTLSNRTVWLLLLAREEFFDAFDEMVELFAATVWRLGTEHVSARRTLSRRSPLFGDGCREHGSTASRRGSYLRGTLRDAAAFRSKTQDVGRNTRSA
jgi:hypothetical protein